MNIKIVGLAITVALSTAFGVGYAKAQEQVTAKQLLAKAVPEGTFIKAPWVESQGEKGVTYYVRYTVQSQQCAVVLRDHGNDKLDVISPTC